MWTAGVPIFTASVRSCSYKNCRRHLMTISSLGGTITLVQPSRSRAAAVIARPPSSSKSTSTSDNSLEAEAATRSQPRGWSLHKDSRENSRLVEKLKSLYCQNVMPLEKHYMFDAFYSPPLGDADFEAKAMMLFVGQYSTGKSSMIR